MERFGLGFEDVHELNPRAVYGSVSGFGSGAAGRELPGYDLLLQAMGGLMSVTGEAGEEGRPLKVGAALVDMISGLYLTNAVLAALHERERSGTGQRVEVSLMDGALAALLNQGSGYLTAGAVPGRMGNRHPSIAPYETFAARDRQTRGGRRQRRDVRPALRGARTPRARRPTSASRRTPRASATATRSAPRSRARWPATTRRPGRSGSPRRACRPARSTTLRRPTSSPSGSGSSRSTQAGGVRTARSPMRLGRTPVVDAARTAARSASTTTSCAPGCAGD